MDVFKLRDSVVSEYRDYVESFIRVLDPRVGEFVNERLDEGRLWPESVLQLNPAYEQTRTLGELAAEGVIREETARFFGQGIRLYQHQQEALEAAQRGENYVVTTGTGSGKSLTYLVPIYDAIMRDHPEEPGVRAVLVFPMNALINSQYQALQDNANQFSGNIVRFEQYTGQTRHEAREEIQRNPPHILLTNYVMLEYLLLRPRDRDLLATATRNLRFIVMDELHFYRGRQGADVSMLLRRLSRHAREEVQYIGTSATMATEGTRQNRRATIARVANQLFGAHVPVENVIDETLRPVAEVGMPSTDEELRAAVLQEPPAHSFDAVVNHPLSAWVEQTFGLTTEDGRSVRQSPQTFAEARETLANRTGLDRELCFQRLQAVLEAGNEVTMPDSGEPVFAFRLHQFLSSGTSISASIAPLDSRHLTMDDQYQLDDGRVMFPLAFCRECGQDYYLVSLTERQGQEKLLPRSPMVGASDDEMTGTVGYFSIEDGDLWSDDHEEMPEFWFDWLKSGPRIKKDFAEHIPRELTVEANGNIARGGSGVRGWFQPTPWVLCLRCRVAYDRRRGGEFRKMASLSQTGRSTATTVAVNAAVTGMLEQDVPRKEAKALSFTDNRQDASLQAGHLNDFVQTAQVRAGVVQALGQNSELRFEELGQTIFRALDLSPSDFLKEAVTSGPGYEQGAQALIDLLQYRALEDQSRGWRVIQPNLEQTGQLRIDYYGLDKLVADDGRWTGVPAIETASPERRFTIIKAFLDHLRTQLAIDAPPLRREATQNLSQRASSWLKAPWSLEGNERERLKWQSLALLPDVAKSSFENRFSAAFSTGRRSSVLRYLRDRETWGIEDRLSLQDGEELVFGIVNALRGHILSVETDSGGKDRGVRINAGAMRWVTGDNTSPPPDPVRARALHLRRDTGPVEPNRYFSRLYAEKAHGLKGMLGREHTGQVKADDRLEREVQFRRGELSTLFCSPTMELGVDIRELQMVHMRNIPPTPANYAQRSGRAGRGGKPALIAVFAAQGNAHDQHYFERRNEMIVGAVAPARMDLANPELLEAHVYSIWLAATGVSLGNSMKDILELESGDTYQLLPEIKAQIEQQSHIQTALSAAYELVHRTPELQNTRWYNAEWLEETVRKAPSRFNTAFCHWREMYRSAIRFAQQAVMQSMSPSGSKADRDAAERRFQEARREQTLLLNEGSFEESDFYPYRYLAAEGFLPGYNFPRLPIRALVRSGNDTHSIDRSRFLGLTEFGPRNVLYHEGRKHRVHSVVVPADGIETRIIKARLCKTCGYFHNETEVELCEQCGTHLDAENSDYPQALLEQPTVRTRITERISSDEEERVRNGYHVTTHFRFQTGNETANAQAVTAQGTPLLDITYAPAASIWRINHGWRSGDRTGFTLDEQTGVWMSQASSQAQADDDQPDVKLPLTGVKPYVWDTKNLLLIRPVGQPDDSVMFLPTLTHALRRGIQLKFQVEENELAAELIGEGEHLRIMIWEAAEGGIGIGERLLEEPDALAKVARQALELCHYDPATGEEKADHDPEKCAVACYQCLMSYSNQRDHGLLDRREVKDFLMALSGASTQKGMGDRTREEHFQWLMGLADPASSLERKFLEFLYQGGYRLPDTAQHRPSDEVYVQPDFFYERDGMKGVCVFVDGSVHDSPEQMARDAGVRGELRDLGFKVVAIRYDAPIADQVLQYVDVFGKPL